MREKLNVRPFVPQDMTEVIELLQEISSFRPAAESISEIGSRFVENKGAYACVVELSGTVVAFGSLFIFCRVRGGCSAIIEDMVVAEAFRGKGLGRLILDDLLAYAQAKGCFKVTLETSERGRDFYMKAGFELGGQIVRYNFTERRETRK
jgi:GNAT superfamily N-acetyltransferase